ncbi:hypothetical protein AB1L30_19225 [Bremerella sp. JC817]|uniref:hypothetical protein n=1 Tax=Bremerella sp. JC817 TaxID=3231756 RepID=UPI003458F55B
MSKTRCRCGFVLIDIESPCEDLYWGIPDAKMWPLVKEFSKAPESAFPTDDISAALAVNGFTFYKCPECDRLLVFWDPENPEYCSYRLEE